MSSFAEGLWRHLAEHGNAAQAQVPVEQRRTLLDRSRAAVCVAAFAVVLAAAIAAAGLTTKTAPAYAVTVHQNGTVTVLLRDVAAGAPRVNMKLRRLGIPETVIPVRADCKAPMPLPLSIGITAVGQPITVSVKDVPRGQHGFIAARQLRNGKVLLAAGFSSVGVPACLRDLSSHFRHGRPLI